MFTSEPSLAQRIERMIGDTPVVDPHSSIDLYRPNATDLAALMGERAVKAGLIASGMPEGDLHPALPPDERVRRSILYLQRMRNTSAAWCLFRIFRDLYDFDEPNLTEANYRDLVDKVAKTTGDPDWARSVLQDRSNIRAVVTGLSPRDAGEPIGPEFLFARLKLDSSFTPGRTHEPEAAFADLSTTEEFPAVLEARLGERPTTTDKLDRLVLDWLDRTVIGKVRFTSAYWPLDWRPFPPDESSVRALLDRMNGGRAIPRVEVDELANFVTRSILKWHHENRRTLAIAVGAEPFPGVGASLVRAREDWAAAMAPLFHQFGGAKFALMTASPVLGRDVAELAGQLANVYAAGDRSHESLPSRIEENLALRVQLAPMSKVVGFASDASSVEWVYGRFQLARKAMAVALARMVDARFFEEDEVPPLLRQILHDTPRDLYDLGER